MNATCLNVPAVRLHHGAAHLTLRGRLEPAGHEPALATGIGEEQIMGSRIGKKERRARRSRRDNMARGAKEPQHEMTYSERVKASSKGGSLGKRMNASKRRQRTPTVSRAPRLCCETTRPEGDHGTDARGPATHASTGAGSTVHGRCKRQRGSFGSTGGISIHARRRSGKLNLR